MMNAIKHQVPITAIEHKMAPFIEGLYLGAYTTSSNFSHVPCQMPKNGDILHCLDCPRYLGRDIHRDLR